MKPNLVVAYLGIAIGTLIAIGCTGNSGKVPDSKTENYGREIDSIDLRNLFENFLSNEEIQNLEDSLLIMSFEGTCPSCIVRFSELVKELQILNEGRGLTVFYVGKMYDSFLVESVFEQVGIFLSESEHLIADSKNEILGDANNYEITLVLTNKFGKVFHHLDPTISEKGLESIYLD